MFLIFAKTPTSNILRELALRNFTLSGNFRMILKKGVHKAKQRFDFCD